MKLAGAFLAMLVLTLPARAEELPIFDAHLHYSHDAWASFPVETVITILREAGIKGALLSSSDDAGQQRLHAAAPELIVPELRPYRRRGETGSWIHDPTVVDYLEQNLRARRYVGIGEFHLDGAEADLPVPRRMVELARQYDLHLHAHSNADAIERLFAQWPEARILWAHAGFAAPAEVRAMLRRYPALRADLSFRMEIADGAALDPEWRALFLDFPDRFLVGTDTFTPGRWRDVVSHANWARAWLATLPREVAERIAWRNAEALLGERQR